MTAKHTPGPWMAHPYSSVAGCPISAQPDRAKNTIIIAAARSAAAEDLAAFRAEIEANARLIAAAPDMLAALERIADPAPGVKRLPPWAVGIARAAIAKARGEAV